MPIPVFTEEDICNLALGRIGQWTVTDLSLNSSVEKICRTYLPQIRRTMLRRHSWDFAIHRLELPIAANPNAFGYRYRYSLPEDYLQTLGLWIDDRGDIKLEKFKVEGQAVLADSPTAYLEYVRDIVDPADWTTDFIECAAVMLASRIAVPLGAGPAMAKELLMEFEQMIFPVSALNNAYEDASGENNPLQQRLRESAYVQQNRSPQ